MIALAYMNWSRWVADCPADGCSDARLIDAGQMSVACIRGHVSSVQWPGDAAVITAITTALDRRPVESTRNWFPAGHPMAQAGGYPVDQTPAELDAETAAGIEASAAADAQLTQLTSLLADMGITVSADGTAQIPSADQITSLGG